MSRNFTLLVREFVGNEDPPDICQPCADAASKKHMTTGLVAGRMVGTEHLFPEKGRGIRRSMCGDAYRFLD